MRVIKVTTDKKISIIDLDMSDLDAIYNEIGGFECVRTKDLVHFFQEDVIMVVDDDGFAKDKPYNPIASFFYPGDIVGDVLFVPEEHGEFVDFYDVDAQCIYLTSRLGLE